MSSSENPALTLSDIRACMRRYCRGLVYQQDSLFYQATSQPKWMSAILSRAIIGCMTQNSGAFENSEASNFIRKNIGVPSHNIDAKLRYLYDELIKDDYRAIAEEEAHLHIALSRCAYILSLNDSQMWGSTKSGAKISDRYKDNLSNITTLSPEGAQLSIDIKNSLIASIGLKIGRQCLPYDYTSDDVKEGKLSEILGAIDSVKLLTAAIIIALNYQNNSLERRNNDKTVDALTKRIHEFLLANPTERPHGRKSAVSETGFAFQSKSASEDEDDLLMKFAAQAHEAELNAIRASIKDLEIKLVSDTNPDITNELDYVNYCCRRAKYADNLRIAIALLGNCERVTADKNRFSEDIHLSILLALVPLEIRLIMQEIDALNERLISCKTRYDRKSLITLIDVKIKCLNEKHQELKQYLHELECLQQEGLSKDSVLSLYIRCD